MDSVEGRLESKGFIYSIFVVGARAFLNIVGVLDPLVNMAANTTMELEKPDKRENMKQFTPGTFDQATGNATGTTDHFYNALCFANTSESEGYTFQNVSTDVTEKNNQLGFKRITFCARDSSPCVNISGWYLPSEKTDMPTIIVTPGLGVPAMKWDNMLPASFIRNRLKYNVLAFDLRNHGFSQDTNGARSWGRPEMNDILGAIDCITTGCGGTVATVTSRIGIHATSAGAYQGIQAFSVEEQIPGISVNSGVFDLQTFTTHGVSIVFGDMIPDAIYNLIPTSWIQFFADILYDPTKAVLEEYGFEDELQPKNILPESTTGRQVLLTHGLTDNYVVSSQTELAETVFQEKGYNVTKWLFSVPTDADAECPYGTTEAEDWTYHIAGAHNFPKSWIEEQSTFWYGVFGE